MPFFEAFSTAGGGGVLGDKHGMIFHRGLLAVVFRPGRRQPLPDKISGMPFDRLESLIVQIL